MSYGDSKLIDLFGTATTAGVAGALRWAPKRESLTLLRFIVKY